MFSIRANLRNSWLKTFFSQSRGKVILRRISYQTTILENNKTIELLFRRYLKNECTPHEIKILLEYFGAGENEALLKKLIHEQSEEYRSATDGSYQVPEHLLETSFANIKNTISSENKKVFSLPFYKQKWFRVSAAAAVIFLVSTTAFYFLHKRSETIVALEKPTVPVIKDIPPGKDNAVLTLGDGTTIVLDSAANGALAQQGNIKVLKINGQIAYNKTDSKMDRKPVYNTITTANGNQYQLILTDGSKVWLNAASSIRFPTAFTGDERKVEITGEAYFEVAKDATKPFRVEFKSKSGENEEVEVLGTHFNVNAYEDEPEMKTTLLEGSVRIKNGDGIKMLAPGQQARITSKGIEIKNNIDLDQVVAWKNGYFVFNSVDIYTLMRQVQRWYDVDVSFEGKVSEDGYTGKISRDVPLSKFLHVLELNEVHIKTEGRKVVITP